MPKQSFAVMLVVLILATFSLAKDKKKQAVPDVVLHARTVAVVVIPGAGEPVMDVAANRDAVDDVERALTKWGRFLVEMNDSTADLIIAVRRGHPGATPTIQGGRIGDRDVIVQRTESTTRVGVQTGNPGTGLPNDSPHTGMEVGSSQDYLEVRLGRFSDPLQGARVWSYAGKNALQAPSVTAVTKFREAVEEAEKQQKKP